MQFYDHCSYFFILELAIGVKIFNLQELVYELALCEKISAPCP